MTLNRLVHSCFVIFAFAQTERADFFGLQGMNGREAEFIEFPHGALVHDSGRMQTFSSFVDRGHQSVTVLFSHRSSPL